MSQRRIMNKVHIGFKSILKSILWVSLLISTVNTSGQKLESGIGLGGLLYWGDLTPNTSTEGFSNARFGGQFYIRSEVKSNFDLRLNFLLGKLNGDDRKSSTPSQLMRNLRFHSMITEVSLLGASCTRNR